MAEKCKGYAGRIKGGSTQDVKAPFSSGGSTKGNIRVTGNDLRTGNHGKSGK